MPTSPAAGPPAYAAATAPASRPGPVTIAGIVLIVLGGLVALAGLAAFAVGNIVGGMFAFGTQGSSVAGAIGGVVAVFAVILIAWGVLEVVTGIFTLSGQSWARITGIVLSIIGVLFSLGGLGSRGGGIVFAIVVLAAYGYTIWALATNGAWFNRARSGT